MSYFTHRPELHVTPEQGILNAPAGALVSGETWHVFHQYQPQLDAPARWAHQYSDVLPFDWDICDDVLAAEGKEIKVRAGSVVGLQDGTVELFFTSITPEGTEVHLAIIEDLEATTEEVSDDALALDHNVRRVGPLVTNRDGFTDFRSPCVIGRWNDGASGSEAFEEWLMLSVSGPQDSPRLMVLDSQDRRKWNLRGPLQFEGDSGLDGDTLIVSPRLSRLRDEVDGKIYDVLLVTLECDGIDISGYLVGTLHGTTYSVHTPFTRLDFGHDFTRPRNTNVMLSAGGEAPSYESAVLFGLLNGIGRFDDPREQLSLSDEGWANCLSLPRLATLQDGLIYQTPAPGMPAFVSNSDRASMFSTIVDASGNDAKVKVELVDSHGNVGATVTHCGDTIELDRSMNPNHSGDHVAEGPLVAADTDAMTIVVDGSTLEVFADGGALAMASRVYFQAPIVEFRVTPSGGATIERQLDIFPLDFSALGEFELEPPLADEPELTP